MLSQVLPGFRDFRTPLVTGYLWLFCGWLMLGMPIPDKGETTGIIGMLNWLMGYTSGATLLVVLSFVAYIIGLLLTVDAKIATRLVSSYGFTLERSLNDEGRPRWKRLPHRDNVTYRRSLANESGSTLLKLLWGAFSRVENKNVSWKDLRGEYQLPIIPEEQYERLLHELEGDERELNKRLRKDTLRELSPALSREMDDEIPVLATKLQEQNKDLFGAYDRDRSEAEFRFSVALPIAFLSVQVLARGFFEDSLVLIIGSGLGLIASYVLLRKGWRKVLDSTSVVVTALEIGVIDSHVIEKLDGLRGRQRRVSIPPPSLG